MAFFSPDFARQTQNLVVLDEIFNETMKSEVEESIGLKIFNEKSTSKQNETIQINHGAAGVAKVDPGQNYPVATGSEGDKITYAQKKYGVDVIVTKEARMFDDYGTVMDYVPTVIIDFMNKCDQTLADIISRGFLATAYVDAFGDNVSFTGPDGLALFSAAHTNGQTASTFSNILTNGATVNPSLGVDAVLAGITKGKKYKNPNGINMPIKNDTILVAPELQYLAERIAFSEYLPGTANNDINPTKGKIKEVITWAKLSEDATGTDRSAQWYMYDSKKVNKSLKLFWAQMPDIAAPETFNPNYDWHYLFDAFYSRGFAWQAYIYGSKGTNAS